MNDTPDRYSNPLSGDPVWMESVSTDQNPSVDRLKATLQVIKRAEDDRRQGMPRVTDAALNDTQEDIRQTAVDAVRKADADLMEKLSSASARMVEDSEEISAAERIPELVTSLTLIIRAEEPLKQLAVDYVAANDERDTFIRKNALNPPAPYQEHLSMFVIALIVTMSCETGMNALVLKEVNGYGLIGGFGVSLLISATNGALGLVGGLGWRLLCHFKMSMRVLGGLVTAAASVGALLCNVIAAHYRQVAEDSMAQQGAVRSSFDAALTPGDAAGTATQLLSSAMPRAEQVEAAVSHLREFGVFGFSSLWSWVLLVVGLGIFATVCYKSWDDYGRYFGFRSRDLRHKRAKAAFDQHLGNIEDSAFSYIEEHKNGCDAAFAALEHKASLAYRVAIQAERRYREMTALVERWVQASNRLLKLYREANAKQCEPENLPTYWSRYDTVEDYKQFLVCESPLSEAGEAGAESPIQAIRNRRKALDRILRNSRRERDEFARITVDLAKGVPSRMAFLRGQVLEWAKGEVARLFPSTP